MDGQLTRVILRFAVGLQCEVKMIGPFKSCCCFDWRMLRVQFAKLALQQGVLGQMPQSYAPAPQAFIVPQYPGRLPRILHRRHCVKINVGYPIVVWSVLLDMCEVYIECPWKAAWRLYGSNVM